MTAAAAPTDIRSDRAERRLEIAFDDGSAISLPAELLRVESPSAAVQGHHPAQKRIVAGKRQVAISAIESVGNYAIRIRFSDGHDTGIYTWAWLHRMGRDQAQVWSAYEAALAAAGLTRDG